MRKKIKKRAVNVILAFKAQSRESKMVFLNKTEMGEPRILWSVRRERGEGFQKTYSGQPVLTTIKGPLGAQVITKTQER